MFDKQIFEMLHVIQAKMDSVLCPGMIDASRSHNSSVFHNAKTVSEGVQSYQALLCHPFLPK